MSRSIEPLHKSRPAHEDCGPISERIEGTLGAIVAQLGEMSGKIDLLMEKVVVGNGRSSLMTRMELVEQKIATVDERTKLPQAGAVAIAVVSAVLSVVAGYVVFRITH